MRRLFIALMSGVLIAALVPSVALAARTPKLTSIEVTSLGPSNGYCRVQVTASFKGSGVTAMAFRQVEAGTYPGTSTPAALGSGSFVHSKGRWSAHTVFSGDRLWTDSWTWSVLLLKTDGIAVDWTAALPDPYSGSGTSGSCPADGTILVSYPAAP